MTKSMTAYGRATDETPFGKWTLEIHSVNRKHLELAVYLPKDFLRFDIEIRKWISEGISRGFVTVRLTQSEPYGKEQFFNTSLASLKDMKEFWDKIASSLGFKQEVNLTFLVNQMHLGGQTALIFQEDTKIITSLRELCYKALDGLMRMKKNEGEQLSKDIAARLFLVSKSLEQIEQRGTPFIEQYLEKLKEKMKELSLLSGETADRLSREMVLLTEKLDITEEIIRLKSHVFQMSNLLDSKEKSIGRTLDFLSQEMGREINTIGAKSADEEISKQVILIKAEIEKIREQAQNIE